MKKPLKKKLDWFFADKPQTFYERGIMKLVKKMARSHR